PEEMLALRQRLLCASAIGDVARNGEKTLLPENLDALHPHEQFDRLSRSSSRFGREIMDDAMFLNQLPQRGSLFRIAVQAQVQGGPPNSLRARIPEQRDEPVVDVHEAAVDSTRNRQARWAGIEGR